MNYRKADALEKECIKEGFCYRKEGTGQEEGAYVCSKNNFMCQYAGQRAVFSVTCTAERKVAGKRIDSDLGESLQKT